MMPTIFEIIEKAGKIWSYLAERKAQANVMRELTVVHGSKMSNLLNSLHDNKYPMLERAGHMWPIAVWSNIGNSQNDIDSILGALSYAFSPDTSLADHQYLEQLKKSKRKLFNGTTFVLENADLSSQNLTINCGLGQYYDAIMTCDSLDAELIKACIKRIPSSLNELLDLCPKRREFCKRCDDPAFSGDGRSAAIGISTLIAYQLDSQYLAFIRARSLKVATHPGRHHVIPSGMLTAETDDHRNEFSIRHSLYREYQEELFEDRDLERPAGQLNYNWFYEKQQLEYLRELLSDGRATLYISGYSIDLTNYRPEILLLLIVNEKGWAKQRISPNFEWADPQDMRDRGRDVLLPNDLSVSDSDIVSIIESVSGGILAPGMAALWSGKDMLAKILSNTEPADPADPLTHR